MSNNLRHEVLSTTSQLRQQLLQAVDRLDSGAPSAQLASNLSTQALSSLPSVPHRRPLNEGTSITTSPLTTFQSGTQTQSRLLRPGPTFSQHQTGTSMTWTSMIGSGAGSFTFNRSFLYDFKNRKRPAVVKKGGKHLPTWTHTFVCLSNMEQSR